MVKILLSLFYFDLLKSKGYQNFWNPLIFLLSTFSLFLVSFDPSCITTSHLFVLFWIILLFIVNLHFSHFLRDDYEDGTIDLIQGSPIAFEWIFMTKLMSQWVRFIGPIFLFLGLIGIILEVPFGKYVQFLTCLLISSLFLSATTAFISIISLGGKTAAYVSPILTLPLNIPLLIINTMEINFTFKVSLLGSFLSLIFPLFLLAKKYIFDLRTLETSSLVQ